MAGLVAGCVPAPAGPAPVEAAPPAQDGEACGPASPCASWLVCVDGACSEREWPVPAQSPPTLAPGAVNPGGEDLVDAGEADPDVDSEMDGAGPADAADIAGPMRDADVDGDALGDETSGSDAGDGAGSQDVAAMDGDGGSGVGPQDAASGDVPEPGDAALDEGASPDDAGGADTLEVVEDSGGPPPLPETVVLLVSEDDPDTPAGEAYILLTEGQAWVAGLTLGQAGDLIGLQIHLADAFGSASCGMFRPAAWVPLANGTYWPEPSWSAPAAIPLGATDEPQVVLLAEPEALPAGKLRLGLIFEGLCAGEPPKPVLLSDSTGDTSRTWLWAPEAEGPPWVPAGVFGVEGRWIFRALVEVAWSAGP